MTGRLAPGERLSLGEARRIAIAAQGLDRARPKRVTSRHVGAVIERLKLLQIDAVCALERAHYLPLFSRLGPYDKALLDQATSTHPRRLVETWAHEASFIQPELYPFFGWRRDQPERYAWGLMRQAAREYPETVVAVRRALQDGPLSAKRLRVRLGLPDQRLRTGDAWGNWSVVKGALEWLFWTGEVTAAARTPGFERVYGLAAQVVPDLAADRPGSHGDQQRRLVEYAAEALGIGQIRSLADYFRLPIAAARAAVAELVEGGRLAPVRVEGLRDPFYLHVGAAQPGRARGRALLSPFDSMIFDRHRVEQLFGMRYRLEYYLPVARRVYGYFVMPFLLGQTLVARVDVKADRRAGLLRVPAAWLEPGFGSDAVAPALAEELRQLAAWLGFGEVIVSSDGPGDLTARLAGALGQPRVSCLATATNSRR
ncbi:MAG: winged helix DNA-binding domain-containing protein [Bifidobacteriaceae bacterium]|nr:winged helix DNA-binding domain-containing protein [Bifidobacteriaceae bacterium]